MMTPEIAGMLEIARSLRTFREDVPFTFTNEDADTLDDLAGDIEWHATQMGWDGEQAERITD
jgi:hypothetical protein